MIRVLLSLAFCVTCTSSDPHINDETNNDVALYEVPSLAFIYDLQNFPGQVDGYCETGGNDTIKIEFLPLLSLPKINDTNTTRQHIYWGNSNIAASQKARGLTCYIASDTDKIYNVLVPLLDSDSKYVPLRLTATINDKEDLLVSFRNNIPGYGEVMWQKEAINANKAFWKTAQINENKEILIKFNELSEEGFYSFKRSSGDTTQPKSKAKYGTLAITIRKCPRDKYGEGCNDECPECMYEGICHDKTGKCVCPPGRIGSHCEISCKYISTSTILIGPECKIAVDNPTYKLMCLPTPYGCSCAPGKSGLNCTEECLDGKWGVDCKYSCNHCTTGICNKVTGMCNSTEDEEPCAGGSLGLPRLKDKPKVNYEMNGDPSKQRVTFKPWEENDKGFGKLPEDAEILGYKVELMGNTSIIRNVRDNVTTVTLAGLKEGTHEVAVLVVVQLKDGTNCTNDGSYRGTIIQKTSFSVSCPERNFPPSFVSYEASETELSLSWKDSPCDKEKGMTYKLELFSGSLGTSIKGETQDKYFEFRALQPNQMYNITFESCLQDINCSEPITIGFYTDSKVPTEILESSGKTVKIRLPTVLHPPACQYVVVLEIKHEVDDETVKKKSLDIVTKYSEDDLNTCPNTGEGPKSLTEDSDGITAYIAGGISVQNGTANDFEIGNGEDNNKYLDDGKDYKVTVVTETKSGDRKTYSVSKPINTRTATAAGLTGFLFGALFFVLLIFLFVWTNRVRKTRRHAVTTHEQNDQGDNVSMDILGMEVTSSGSQNVKDGLK